MSSRQNQHRLRALEAARATTNDTIECDAAEFNRRMAKLSASFAEAGRPATSAEQQQAIRAYITELVGGVR